MINGSFRLYDFVTSRFEGPLETRAQAEKRKSSRTTGKRDTLSNWYRIRVHPVQVESDGETITDKWRECITRWRKETAPTPES